MTSQSARHQSSFSESGTTGVLLVGHGTRSQIGQAQFLALAEQVRRRLAADRYVVEPAFLELANPTIGEGVAALVRRGIDNLIVAPALLFSAGHAKDDIPAAVRRSLALAGSEDLPVRQTPHFGLHPRIVDLACERFKEAGLSGEERQRACLVLVGRGSHDAEATREMFALAEMISAKAQIASVKPCFLAMAQPRLEDLLSEVAATDFERIVVQPHLLFHGDLPEGLSTTTSRFRDSGQLRHPNRQWAISRILGDDLLSTVSKTSPLAELLVEHIHSQ